MGFMDNFTSDCPVTVKQPDYYEMIKQAAKAELIENAVKADVPGRYIKAMLDGQPVKPEEMNIVFGMDLSRGNDFETTVAKESEGTDDEHGSSTEAEPV